jgi:hypothetical protein
MWREERDKASTLVVKVMSDDCFYFLKVARNGSQLLRQSCQASFGSQPSSNPQGWYKMSDDG